MKNHFVDQADSSGLMGIDALAGQDKHHRVLHGHLPGQALQRLVSDAGDVCHMHFKIDGLQVEQLLQLKLSFEMHRQVREKVSLFLQNRAIGIGFGL